ncbi:hypothetical protein F5Y19DRAFT_428463 [Xylariaceae sp. FL1651]|nr:hypothetical protein F5Y19DRAFT_428463 [Xylariaceae sp. FL1651]
MKAPPKPQLCERGENGHVSNTGTHYPLNGVDLDFRHYVHRPLGGRDILVNHIMEDYLNPRRVSPKIYLAEVQTPRGFGRIKSQDRELGLDLQVLWRLLQMGWPGDSKITFQHAIIELIQRHYLECDPLIHYATKVLGGKDEVHSNASGWRIDMINRLALFQQASSIHHRYSVFSGNSQLPYVGLRNAISLGSCFIALPWEEPGTKRPRSLQKQVRQFGFLGTPHSDFLHRQKPSRSQSLPPDGSWDIAMSSFEFEWPEEEPCSYVTFFPRNSLPKLDKMSRRRSLSRSHIRAMFTNKPEWINQEVVSDKPQVVLKHPCSNCAQYTHSTKNCSSSCGYCNSFEHKAHSCSVKAANRCKCRPFPQFHRASQCFVRCSRKCGSSYPPGHFKHINAMLCSHRCCMCGIKGHNGRKCSMKKCSCGEQHLTQDCRWKVECPAQNCNKYLCTSHCRECGKKKEKGLENHFVGRICQDCLKNGIPVSARA